MTEQSLELSYSGFRFPYHRFLADIAAGIFAILLLAFAYYSPESLPNRLSIIKPKLSTIVSTEVKIFLMIILGVAVVPIGLILNGAGWFILGCFQRLGVQTWYRCKAWAPSVGTNIDFRRDLLGRAFDITANTLYPRAKFFEKILEVKAPSHLHEIRHVRGLTTMARSLGLLALLGMYIYWPFFVARFSFLIAFLVAIIFMGLLEYYWCLAILSRAMILTLIDIEGVVMGSERYEVKRLLLKVREPVLARNWK